MRPRLRAAGGAWRGHCNLDPRPPGHPCGPSRRRGSWGSEGAWVAALHPRVEPRRPGIRVWLSTPGNRVLPGRTAPPDLETHRAPALVPRGPRAEEGSRRAAGGGTKANSETRRPRAPPGPRAPWRAPGRGPPGNEPRGRWPDLWSSPSDTAPRGSGPLPRPPAPDAPTRGRPARPAAPAPSVRPALLPGAPRAAPSAVWEVFGREPKLGAESHGPFFNLLK